MNNILEQMGERILAWRKERNMTQEQLAEKVGVTAQTISTAELGKKALRPENIVKLSAVMGVSTDYLLLGKVTSQDAVELSRKISGLTPKQSLFLF